MATEPRFHLTTRDHAILQGLFDAYRGPHGPYLFLLEQKLRGSALAFSDDIPADVVTLGSTIAYTVDGTPAGPHLLVEGEAPEAGVSVLSLRGLALLGLSEGAAALVDPAVQRAVEHDLAEDDTDGAGQRRRVGNDEIGRRRKVITARGRQRRHRDDDRLARLTGAHDRVPDLVRGDRRAAPAIHPDDDGAHVIGLRGRIDGVGHGVTADHILAAKPGLSGAGDDPALSGDQRDDRPAARRRYRRRLAHIGVKILNPGIAACALDGGGAGSGRMAKAVNQTCLLRRFGIVRSRYDALAECGDLHFAVAGRTGNGGVENRLQIGGRGFAVSIGEIALGEGVGRVLVFIELDEVRLGTELLEQAAKEERLAGKAHGREGGGVLQPDLVSAADGEIIGDAGPFKPLGVRDHEAARACKAGEGGANLFCLRWRHAELVRAHDHALYPLVARCALQVQHDVHHRERFCECEGRACGLVEPGAAQINLQHDIAGGRARGLALTGLLGGRRDKPANHEDHQYQREHRADDDTGHRAEKGDPELAHGVTFPHWPAGPLGSAGSARRYRS